MPVRAQAHSANRVGWRRGWPSLAALTALVLLNAMGAGTIMAQNATDDGMVLVGAGPFTMGSEGKAVDEDAAEKPVHTVTVAAFRIDRNEVTTAQYCAFLKAAGKEQDAQGRALLGPARVLPIAKADGAWKPQPGRESFPMTGVTWYGATAYAAWAGKRLPTEAEWEKAARGTDGRKFPWGNSLERSKLRFGQDSIGPVGSKPEGASPSGCLDMAGNAWEWTSTAFRPYPYVASDGREDPALPDRRVARGGSWAGEPDIAHAAYRFRPEPTLAYPFLGFRCAKSAE
jgi:formylglycine-generating enzyme required for sulfatase activity